MDKDNEIPEIVGATDLRQVFADKGTIKGSFFINNVEFHQFQANSIENVLAQINAKSSEAYVDASIDEGFHLVLEAQSPAPILIRLGRQYVETAPVGQDATAQAVKAAIEQTRKDDDQKHETKNTVLDDLGLPALAHDDPAAQVPGGITAGMNAEDRHRRRHEAAAARGAIRYTPPVDPKAPKPERVGSRAVPQAGGGKDDNRRYNPVTPADKVMPPGGGDPRMPGSPFMAPDANNPTVQVAPSSNSDRQPTGQDLRHPS